MANSTDNNFGGTPDVADHFTTGSLPMSITSVDVIWTQLGAPAVNRIGIYTDNAGLPSTTLVGSFFTNPNLTSLGAMTYKGNVTLAANTTYWVVVDISDNSFFLASTNSTSFVADPSTGGAVILPQATYGDNLSGSWNALINPKLKFALNATPVSVPTLSQWGVALLILMIAGFGVMRVRSAKRGLLLSVT